jgi:hypothetical protein
MSRKYKDQFKIQTLKTDNGFKEQVIYQGNYYSAAVPAEKLKRYKAALKGSSLVMALLFIGMGLINNDGSRVFYVILPYALLSLPLFFMLISTIAFNKAKDKLTVPEYEKTVVRVKTTANAAFILSTAGAVGGLFFILSGKGSTPGREIIFLCGYLAIALSAFLSIQIHKKVQYTQLEKTVPGTEED